LTDFDEIWHGDAVRPSWLFDQLQRSKEIQDAGGATAQPVIVNSRVSLGREW